MEPYNVCFHKKDQSSGLQVLQVTINLNCLPYKDCDKESRSCTWWGPGRHPVSWLDHHQVSLHPRLLLACLTCPRGGWTPPVWSRGWWPGRWWWSSIARPADPSCRSSGHPWRSNLDRAQLLSRLLKYYHYLSVVDIHREFELNFDVFFNIKTIKIFHNFFMFNLLYCRLLILHK